MLLNAMFCNYKQTMPALCEECDETKAIKYCGSCGQKLCISCDLKIHNKGKRALHVRGDLSDSKKECSLRSKERVKLSKQVIFKNGDLSITVFQSFSQPDAKESNEFKQLHEVAMNYYIGQANEGNLMHPDSNFKADVMAAYQNQYGIQPKYELEELYERLKDSNIFHVTVRKFGDSKALLFVSLMLTSISIEAMLWILLSIKNDRMKPSEKLILSRIKEYFLLKINQKDWNTAIEAFYTNPDMLVNCEGLLPIYVMDDRDEKDNSSRCHMTFKSEMEGGKDEKPSFNYRFEIKGDKWEFDDAVDFDDHDCKDWENFKSYIDNFFGEETTVSPGDSRSKLKKQKNNRNIQKWLSSVETALSKPNNSLTSNHSLQKILNEQSISRAIPGGKLCSFVQKALNLNILIYYKTLLIRNNQFDNSSQNASNEAKNAKKISTLKDQILTLLVENKVGLSLAQIPLLLKNKFKKSYNIQSLGFPKLKNLLATMDEVDLEKTQGNLLKAVLKTHIRKNSEKPLEEVSKNNLGGKKFLTLRTNPLDHKLNNLHYSSNMHGNFFQSQEPTSHPVKGCRTVSTLEDYILKIQSTILDILRSNIFGIEVEKLKNELDRWAGVEFNYRIAGAESFQEFLINNLGDYLDIEIKKSLRSAKASGPLIHIVYPKNYKLPQPPKHFFMEEDRNDRFNDEFSNVSPNSLHHYLQSPDASFINCVKPLLNSKYPNIDVSNFKSSQSFNIGKSADCPPGGLLETLSQQGSSTGGELPSSCKSTLSQHQYSHFGKFKAAKGAKATPHDFKLGSQLLKSKDHYRHGKQRTAPQTEIDWISNCQDVDRFAGQVSFENEGLHLSRPADYSASKKQDQGLAAKPTDVAEDLSDAQSQKVLDRLLADEE